jgi:hypothetical protein
VLAHVEEHVGERIPHLPWRAQSLQVVPTEQHAAFAPEDSIHRPRDPRANRLHPSRESFLSRRLHDQMKMIALDRVVTDPEPASFANFAQAGSKRAQEATAAQGRDVPCHAKRYMGWTMSGNCRPLYVMHRRAWRSGFATGADAASTVAPKFHRQLLRDSTHDLILALFQSGSTIRLIKD